MSTTFEADDRIAGFAPAERPGPFAWGRFNAALLAWLLASGFARFVASDRARNVPWAGLVLTTAIDFAVQLVAFGVAAGFLAVFWRRLVAPVASTRPITYAEAPAAILMLHLLFGR